MTSKKIKHLVVDTTAFIKAANLQEFSEHIYTIQEVIDEIRSNRQRARLVVLPYDLKVQDVSLENVKFVTEFSKKTGDYPSLSATDIKVMALTYQIEKEKLGTDHLKTEPTIQKFVKVTGISGFEVHPDVKETEEIVPDDNTTNDQTDSIENNNQTISESVNEVVSSHQDIDEELAEQIKNMDLKVDNNADDFFVKVSNEEQEQSDSEESDSEDSDSDGGDWITPSNIKQKKIEMDVGELEDIAVEVACITSDFAMQNVLKQIGLNVTAVDGRVIKHLRTFIFRCTTCFKTTSVMTKLFCPKCGHATLRKVSVSIDDEGNQHIHINGRKPLSGKGKIFSLPTPKGGQHFQYPILTEDQPIHQSFLTKLARTKVNQLTTEHLPGFSPFAKRDCSSRSAVLGINAKKQDIKYWMKHHSEGKKLY